MIVGSTPDRSGKMGNTMKMVAVVMVRLAVIIDLKCDNRGRERWA
jgi:hypothetical protein